MKRNYLLVCETCHEVKQFTPAMAVGTSAQKLARREGVVFHTLHTWSVKPYVGK